MAEISPGIGKKVVERSAPGSGGETTAKSVSYLELATQGVADGAGDCIISLGMVPTGANWFVERLSVESDSILVSTFALHRDQVSPLTRKTATPAGNDDIEDASSAMWFAGGTNVLAVWAGCTPAANCFINAQIRVES
jgi:hypothetical protein